MALPADTVHVGPLPNVGINGSLKTTDCVTRFYFKILKVTFTFWSKCHRIIPSIDNLQHVRRVISARAFPCKTSFQISKVKS